MRKRTKTRFLAVILAITMITAQAGFAFADSTQAGVQSGAAAAAESGAASDAGAVSPKAASSEPLTGSERSSEVSAAESGEDPGRLTEESVGEDASEKNEKESQSPSTAETAAKEDKAGETAGAAATSEKADTEGSSGNATVSPEENAESGKSGAESAEKPDAGEPQDKTSDSVEKADAGLTAGSSDKGEEPAKPASRKTDKAKSAADSSDEKDTDKAADGEDIALKTGRSLSLASENFEFDNTTSLCDGTYMPDEMEFIWEGGTGKARLNIVKLIVKNGRATGIFSATSESLTHVYLGSTASSAEDSSLYDADTGVMGGGVYAISDGTVALPVKVNAASELAMRSIAMSVPRWINYKYTINIEEPEEFVFDNSTTVRDGLYQADSFDYSFGGGTGRARLDLESVSVRNGYAYGTFTASSASMTHVYLGEVLSNAEDPSLYDASKDRLGPGVYAIEDQTVTIPVRIGSEIGFSVRTTGMGTPHWISYSYRIDIAEEAEADFDNSTDIKAGTYTPDAYVFNGGTGKAKLTCTGVTVKKGKATAVFTASSEGMTHVYLGETATGDENPALFDPQTGVCGKNVYAVNNKTVSIPVRLNETVSIAVRTTSMTVPHWVNYTYKITVKEKSSDPGQEIKPDDGNKDGKKDKDDPTEEHKIPTKKQKLSDGTYKVLTTTDRKMFYIHPKEQDPAYSILTVKDGKMTATITLSGTGYDYVFMGTPEEARKAGESKWIKAKLVNGYYTFRIPVAALDKKLTITPRSARYAEDPEMQDQAWRPDKWIKFYSGDAVKVKDGTTSTADKEKKRKDDPRDRSRGDNSDRDKPNEQKEFKNDNKKDKESESKTDSGGSTGAVNAGTTLPDGVYTPDSFSWSGGSGRLAYIRCNKITVTDGQAYATIEFSSSGYDLLKANGRIYSRSDAGRPVFVIPVELNANNVIIGRTTAMSAPHWIKYVIYIGKAETGEDAEKAEEARKEAAEAKVKISDKAPAIMGLESADGGEETEYHSEYFRIFNYEKGVKLLSVDISGDTALLEKYTENAEKGLKASEEADSVEYDEEGNVVLKSRNEITEGLYRNNVINYLLVPEDFEVPAGLDKEYIIVRVPSEKSFISSAEALKFMDGLDCLDSVSLLGLDDKGLKDAGLGAELSEALEDAIGDGSILKAGALEKPDYAKVVKGKPDLAILSSDLLPEAVSADEKTADDEGDGTEEEKLREAEAKQQTLERLESRFTALDVPVIVDRSSQEKDELAKAEWIKVYGALYGRYEEAEAIFEKQVKEAEKK